MGEEVKFAPVSSSNIHSVGYDPATRALEVKFHSGSHYRYLDVDPTVHQALMASDSLGSFFGKHIRGKHKAEQLAASK